MNLIKKLDRVTQWAGEKMGQETKTAASEEFKALELEMALRHDGMESLHKSMTSYMKSLSKRAEIEDKQKILPVGYLGQTMARHGEDFEPDSEFGNCLIGMGRANERISRAQETYVVGATAGWMESLERSLAMMKEYETARKKLENRRLAYDASLSKMQKVKKEDFRLEEELRSQKAKYEESSEDVLRRMEDIKEAEAESVQDLGTFLDAELEYYDRCREELMRLKAEWPAGQSQSQVRQPQRRNTVRSRSNTAHSFNDRFSTYEEPDPAPIRPSIRSQGRVASSSRLETRTTDRDDYPQVESPSRPTYGRATTFQGPTSIYREQKPIAARTPSFPSDMGSLRGQLRPAPSRANITNGDVFSDPSDDSTFNSGSPDRSYGARSVSPATSQGSELSRTTTNGRKAPPPPPSRAKKPPPPPPIKRADFSSQSISRN